ncbi:MAG: hypothetical protein R2724_08825 [Bryobacterales bacterium]
MASQLGANVVALGHTADDFCESLLRNAMFTGRLSALPAVTNSRSGEFRLIRPLVFTSEEITSGYAEEKGIRLTPCVCSHRTGTVRRSVRGFSTRCARTTPTSSRICCPRWAASTRRVCSTNASWTTPVRCPNRSLSCFPS